MEIKDITKALYDWADESEKRTVLCIAAEKCNETEDSYTLPTSTALNGNGGQIVGSVVDAMEDDEDFANIIKRAFIEYTMKHGKGVGIGIVSVAGKEGKDE